MSAPNLDIPVREFVKPTTLNELLRALVLIDEAMLELDLDQSEDLIELGKVKVDNYKYLIDKMEKMAEELGEREKEYATARRTIDAQCERLKEHMIHAMQANEFDQFPGNQYKVKLQYSEYVDLKLSVPGDHHPPDIVRIKREWDKTKIKSILKNESELTEVVRELASIEKRPGLRFSVLKDV